MKTTYGPKLLLSTVCFFAIVSVQAGNKKSVPDVQPGDSKITCSQELSEVERNHLLQMREEEKLARDVYTTLYEKWGSRVFGNIKLSEQMHMDAVLQLLRKYGVEDPVQDNPVGIFKTARLQELYKKLVAAGSASAAAAFESGAFIEDLDLFDLKQAMAQSAKDDINQVYEQLARGSRNHLRAFVRNLGAVGTTYTVQYISSAEFEAIINGEQERGW